MKNKPIKMYRYVFKIIELYDDYDNHNDYGYELIEYDIVKYTPKGYWINLNSRYSAINKNVIKEKLKWVQNAKDTDKKRFAYIEKKHAMRNFQERTLSRISYLKGNIQNLITALLVSLDNENSYYTKEQLNRNNLSTFKFQRYE